MKVTTRGDLILNNWVFDGEGAPALPGPEHRLACLKAALLHLADLYDLGLAEVSGDTSATLEVDRMTLDVLTAMRRST